MWPIAARLSVAPETPLLARAVRGIELERILDGATASIATLRHRVVAERLLAASLATEDGLVFRSARCAGLLDEEEYQELATGLVEALAIVSPTFARSDYESWTHALEGGAEHPTNLHEAIYAGGCRDAAGQRPDLYFGKPIVELTDGQLMAFRASAALLAKMQKKKLV